MLKRDYNPYINKDIALIESFFCNCIFFVVVNFILTLMVVPIL